jgi:hypothetical protein
MGERPDTDRVLERVAHALDPAGWKGPSVAVGLVVFAGVLALTVVQRALVADSTTAWILTALHGAVVVVVVPALSWRTVREWRARRARPDQAPSGAPE